MEKEKHITVLTVDDEVHILELLKYNLESSGYLVIQAETGEEALRLLKEHPIDLVLLDLMMPGIDGLQVLRTIRSDKELKRTPVIMLTAKNEELDTVLGLEMGADDYVGKPFGIHELLARMKAVMRRMEERGGDNFNEKKEEQENFETIKIDDILINKTTREVSRNGILLQLPLKEFELLFLLAKNPGRVFSREYLLQKIWGYDYYGETRTVDVHIRNLRKKIEDDDKNPFYIRTIRGVGYKFAEKGMN